MASAILPHYSMSTVAPPVPAPRRRRKATKLKRRQTRLAWILLVPALLVVAFVALYPLGNTVPITLQTLGEWRKPGA